MTRFNITIEDGVEMVLHALFNSWGGELYVPKIPSYKILDIAEAIAKSNNELIGFYGSNPSNFVSIDITTNPATQTDLWATLSTRSVQGNSLYTTNGKVIYLNTLHNSSSSLLSNFSDKTA